MLLALVLAVAPAAPAHPPELADRATPAAQARPRGPGVAALTLGALTGAAGLGLGLASGPTLAALEACLDCPSRLPPTMFAAVALNTASLGLLALGAGLRGRALGEYDGAHATAPRRDVPWISLGGLVTGGGVLLVAAGLGWRFAESSRGSATSWTLLQLGMSGVSAGSSLLVYGLTYRKHVALRRELRLVPQLGTRHLGLALVGRF